MAVSRDTDGAGKADTDDAKADKPGEPKADPSDSSYVPKPEWYFLFMFQTLKFLPANFWFLEGEMVGVLAFGLAGLLWTMVPFWDRASARGERNRLRQRHAIARFRVGRTRLRILAGEPADPDDRLLALHFSHQPFPLAPIWRAPRLAAHALDDKVAGPQALEHPGAPGLGLADLVEREDERRREHHVRADR